MYSLHDDPYSLALFIPFEAAWKAVKEFIERDGELPKSIGWIASGDLPPDAFPEPTWPPQRLPGSKSNGDLSASNDPIISNACSPERSCAKALLANSSPTVQS